MQSTVQVLILVLLLLNILVSLYLLLKSSGSNRREDQEKGEEKVRWELLEKGQQRLEQSFSEKLLRLEQSFSEKLSKIHAELYTVSGENRKELQQSFHSFGTSFSEQMVQISGMQKGQLELFANQLQALTAANDKRLEKMRETLEDKLKQLQEENSRKLEEMRVTVDEKLHQSLEKRLGDSFRLVSERLELVHKGLGEMQVLAAGVGDLKKVLSNVKVRGILGEIQLGSILEQLLSPGQYAANVATRKGGSERVEFALKLPGPEDGQHVWLPLDAKFPLEDYQRLLDAYEQASPAAVEAAAKQLESRIRASAKDISQKYLSPPETTDFAIMFLPVEGLFAEVLRRQGLFEALQRDFKVVITGPTTLAALLNSLQMGFKTLAIQKRSGEVWTLLGSVKTDFSNLGEILEKSYRKIMEVGKNIENATRKTGAIEKKLRDVQELPLPRQDVQELTSPRQAPQESVDL